MFVMLFVAFFSDGPMFAAAALGTLLLVIASRVGVGFLVRNLWSYLLILLPISFVLASLEIGIQLQTFRLAALTYTRFGIIMISGAMFVYTTNPTDITLLFFRSKTLRPIGIAVASGLSSITVLTRKARNTFALQKLRGIEFSLHPSRWDRTVSSVESLAIPIIVQAITLSQDYSEALTARGYNPDRRIHLPPHLQFQTVDYLILSVGTLLLITVVFY